MKHETEPSIPTTPPVASDYQDSDGIATCLRGGQGHREATTTAPGRLAHTSRTDDVLGGDVQDKIYWLIEAPGPSYLYAAARIFGWTADVDRALHLATEEQAEALMMTVREHRPDLFPAAFVRPPRAVEHMWVSGTENGSGSRE